MSARFVLSLAVLTVISIPASSAASDDAKGNLPLSLEEINKKRRAVREELMMPSLAGIAGMAYRVVGYKNSEPLEKLMGAKLEHANVPCTPYVKAEAAKKPCEAMVQISFFKTGSTTIAELKVTQWVSLLRNQKISVRAVTYSDKVYLSGNKPEEAIEQLCNEFVIDFLKANQKGFNAEKFASGSKASSKK